MAKKKKKKGWLKKVGKAAALAAAAYGASKMFGGRRKSVEDTAASEDANINYSPLRRNEDYNYIPKPDYGNPEQGLFVGAAKGGRIGAKKGGRVKSMGIAKRGGGAAKR